MMQILMQSDANTDFKKRCLKKKRKKLKKMPGQVTRTNSCKSGSIEQMFELKLKKNKLTNSSNVKVREFAFTLFYEKENKIYL